GTGRPSSVCLDRVPQWRPDDYTGDVGWGLGPPVVHLVHHGKNHGDAGPQFVAPAQDPLERRSSDWHNYGDWRGRILLMQISFQISLIGVPVETAQIKTLAIESEMRVSAGDGDVAQDRDELVVT